MSSMNNNSNINTTSNPTHSTHYPELEQLRDIHLPDPIGWWPPSLALLTVLIIGAILLMLLALLSLRAYRRGALKRAALKELQVIQQAHQTGKKNAYDALNAVAALLRRTCLSRFPRASVAQLTGEAWLTFLDNAYDPSGRANPFRAGAGRALESLRYRTVDASNTEKSTEKSALPGLFEITEKWIKRTC